MRIVVVSADGTFLLSSFEEGGECQRIVSARFVKSEEEVAGLVDNLSISGAGAGTGVGPSPAAGKTEAPPASR